MSNKRVYTVAKEMGMASKDLMAILEQAKIPVKSHMSTITEDQQKELFSFIRQAQGAQSEVAAKSSKDEQKTEERKSEESSAKKAKTEKEVKSTDDVGADLKAKTLEVKDPHVNKKRDDEPVKNRKPHREAIEEDDDFSDDFERSNNKKQKKNKKSKQSKKKDNVDKRSDNSFANQDFEKRKAPKKKSRSQKRKEREAREEAKGDDGIKVKAPLTVKEFADTIGVSLAQVITKLIGLGVMATQNESIDRDVIEILEIGRAHV